MLFRSGVASVSSTEFCQGRTMRWAVAWSFQSEISYPVNLCFILRLRFLSVSEVFVRHWRAGFDSDDLTLSLEFTTEITLIIAYIGVVFSFMGLLSLGSLSFYFLMSLKEALTFLSLLNPVLQ